MAAEQKNDGHGQGEKQTKIEFTVDKEKFTVYADGDTARLTVRQVLDLSGHEPPEEYELIEYLGPNRKDEVTHSDMNEELNVQKHARFAALFKGPTPVS